MVEFYAIETNKCNHAKADLACGLMVGRCEECEELGSSVKDWAAGKDLVC